MSDWIAFGAAFLAFLGSHFVPRLWGIRERLIARFGRWFYFSTYGILSLFLLAWVIAAAGEAPIVEIWPQETWMRWVPNILVPISFGIACWGIGVSNPNTLGGARRKAFDPQNPGFAAISRHPLLLALLLWALAHLVANGDLAHIILFGSFALFPVLAMWGFDRQSKRLLGPRAGAFFAQTAWLSLSPLMTGDWWRRNLRQIVLRGLFAAVLWLGLLHLHHRVIGAWPFP